MKNSLILIFALLSSCSFFEKKAKDEKNSEIRSLAELVNEGFKADSAFRVYDFPNTNDFYGGLVLVLPSSSCFNCFEDLNLYLKEYFEIYQKNEILVVKNSKIKEREIRYSLQKVLSLDKIKVMDINEFSFVKQHEFFPKLAYYSEGKVCCFEIFEQGNLEKLDDYFRFLQFLKD